MLMIAREPIIGLIMQLDNLKSLADCAPLKTPLVLGNHSIKSVTVYNDMNVML